MSEPFIGQIQTFAFNFAPRGWATCDGQLMPVGENSALFSLLGTIYGGDGRTSFGLPDLRGRAPLHMGRGPGLSNRPIGAKGGAEHTTLTAAQMPLHSHQAQTNLSAQLICYADAATSDDPAGRYMGKPAAENPVYVDAGRTASPMAADAVTVGGSVELGNAGSSQAFNNMEPFLTINYCIALMGLFPSRS